MNEIGTPLEEPEVAGASPPGDAVVAPPEATRNPVVITRPKATLKRRIAEHASPRLDVALWVILDGLLIAVILLVDAAVEALRVHLSLDTTDEALFKTFEIVFFASTVAAVVLYLYFDIIALRDSLRERNKGR
jgi:hypothetical protein